MQKTTKSKVLFPLLMLLFYGYCGYGQKERERKTDTLNEGKSNFNVTKGHFQTYEKGLLIGFQKYRDVFFEMGYYSTKGFKNIISGSSVSLVYAPNSKEGGFKVSAWKTGRQNFFMFGLNANSYSQYESRYKPQIGIQPFVGISLAGMTGENLTVSYGYNVNFSSTNSRNKGIVSNHNGFVFSLRLFLNMKRK